MIFNIGQPPIVLLCVSLCLGICLSSDLAGAETETRTVEECAEELQNLSVRIQELETELQRLENLPDYYSDELTVGGLFLRKNPRKIDVGAYIDAIVYRVESRRQSYFDEKDLHKLRQVTFKDWDVLLEKATESRRASSDIMKIINSQVTAEHKGFILAALPRYRGLIKSVVKQGWIQDASDILLSELKKHPQHLPVKWIKSIAEMKQIESYPDLEWYFVNGSNVHWTYRAIKDIPEINMHNLLNKLWQKPRPFHDFERQWLAVKVASYGNKEALALVIHERKNLRKDHFHDQHAERLDTFLVQYLDKSGDIEVINVWFKQNEDKINFDTERKKFVIIAE